MDLALHKKLVTLQEQEGMQRAKRYTLARLVWAAIRTWLDLRAGRLILAKKTRGYIPYHSDALGDNDPETQKYAAN